VEVKHDKVGTVDSKLRDQDVYNSSVVKPKENELLAFQGQEDYWEPREGKGTRGGRGRGGRGGQAAGGQPP